MTGSATRALWLNDRPAGAQYPELKRLGEALRKYGHSRDSAENWLLQPSLRETDEARLAASYLDFASA